MPAEGYRSVYAIRAHRYSDVGENATYSFPEGEVRDVPVYVAELLVNVHPTKLRFADGEGGDEVTQLSPGRVIPAFGRSTAIAAPPQNTAVQAPEASEPIGAEVSESERCTSIKTDGVRCKNNAKTGGTCAVHTPAA